MEVATALAAHQYNLVLCASNSEEQEMENLKRLVQGKTVDGVIVVRTRLNDERVRYLQEKGLPFVCHGKTEDSLPYCFVESDGEKGIKLATGRLVRFGHRRIAWIGNHRNQYATKVRLQGYKTALAMYGIESDEELCSFGPITKANGKSAAERLLDLPNPPTAFVCASDILALGAMEAVRSRGLTVGKDISVIGYDDFPVAEMMVPALTSVNSNFRLMGKMLAEFIYKRIEGAPVEELQTVTDVSISSRLSDGPANEAGTT